MKTYCHVGIPDGPTKKWAILVWVGGVELPQIRFVARKNAQTKILPEHVPQAVASLIALGHYNINIVGDAS